MADIADITAARQELEEEILRQYKRVEGGPAPTGRCHNFDEPVEVGACFCDADWQDRQNMKRINGK